MKIGIFGLPQSGKKTLFGLLTGTVQKEANTDTVSGVADVLDGRFNTLVALYKPRKEARARINIDLLPDVDAEALRDGAIFRDIAGMDALCCVIRAFEDDTVYHMSGSVDAGRDLAMIASELVLHDLLFVEKRLERIEAGKKKPNAEALKKEEDIMLRFRAHLEAERPLRTMELSADDRKIITGYPLITLKKMIAVLNVGDALVADGKLAGALESRFTGVDIEFMQISARIEAEIAALESAAERKEFMEASGITEPAINVLSRTCMRALGLISFFTVGEDEVKQWLVRDRSLAPEAGGAIHSDIQRGFIRAEVIKYDDIIALGTEEAVKKAGKLLVMGKDYPVADGDIISFRFNV
jgi:hypothetical protein